jgi:hypothetical protein
MSSTGEVLSSIPRPFEQFPNLTGETTTETSTVEAFDLPIISLPIETDEDIIPTSAKLPGAARPGPATAPGESDDWAREPTGYSGLRAHLAFFHDDVSGRESYIVTHESTRSWAYQCSLSLHYTDRTSTKHQRGAIYSSTYDGCLECLRNQSKRLRSYTFK